MPKLTFRGGIHPKDNKAQTCFKNIRELKAPEVLVFPLSQHIGAPCNPLVAKGDRVLKGMKIADSDAFVSAPIHSSVSGVVTAIEPRPVPSGQEVMSIVVQNDFADELDPSVKPLDLDSVKPSDIPSIVREAGVVGMGGATFPTHVKLTPAPGKIIDTVIVNGAECEPYLTSDHRVMLETPQELILGLKAILRRFGIKNGHIAIEENKADAIKKLGEMCEGEDGIRVDTLKKKYPQGGEKQLIYAVTKRKVPLGGLPADVGVVVVNVDTCTAIARRFMYGTPLIRRIVTIVGGAIADPCNYRVPIGTTVEYILENAGGFIEEPKKIIMGGPMMGPTQFRLDVPIVKGSSAILCLTEKEVELPEEEPCLRCGRCVDHCPMKLMPLYLADNVRRGNLERCEELKITACIECGCCSYVCPSKRQLVQRIRQGKQDVNALIRKRQEAEKNGK